MNTTTDLAKNKRVLLIIANASRRNLRASVFRNLGVDVVCAAHMSEARALWHPSRYGLVLFDMHGHDEEAVDLCADIKAECPQQRVAWLVGGPEFVASEPIAGRLPQEAPNACADNLRQLMSNACAALPRRGGFLEALWRMALTRSTMPRQQQDGDGLDPAANSPKQLRLEKRDSSFGAAIRKAESAQDKLS